MFGTGEARQCNYAQIDADDYYWAHGRRQWGGMGAALPCNLAVEKDPIKG